MSDREENFIFDIDHPIRLDKALSERFPTYSRTYFQYLIENQGVQINGAFVKKRALPSKGDHISVRFRKERETTLLPEDLSLDLLFEDDALLCINKPVGMVVHPGPGHPSQTFANALIYRAKTLVWDPSDVRPGIVHRLDKETSGVLLGAKTAAAHRSLVEQFSLRKTEKFYLAVCVGHPGNRSINTPIGRSQRDRKKMATNLAQGKEAVTIIKTLARSKELSIVCAQPITGRTHQIRVHLESIGCPILGDPTYGFIKLNQKWNILSQLLHAYQITFTHPTSLKRLTLKANPPPTFQPYLSETVLAGLDKLTSEKRSSSDVDAFSYAQHGDKLSGTQTPLQK